ncbi:MAG: FecR domain-containing protein [Bacteroidota bacterium]
MIEKPNYISFTQYFKGDASKKITSAVESWKAENQEEFSELQSIWEKYGSLATTYKPDLKKAWANIDERTSESSTTLSFNWIVRIAASIVIIAGIAWLFKYGSFSRKSSFETFQATEGNLSFDLEDESNITLSMGSSLKVDEGFGTNNRNVTLSGQGFFEVAKNVDIPFAVTLKDAKITVVGTAFEIKDEVNTFKVIVTEGSVEVKTEGNRVVLKASQKAFFDRNNKALTTSEKISSNHLAWKSGILTFSNMNMTDFASDLEEYYDVKIELANGVKQRQITATFNNQSLDEVFEITQATLGVTVDTLNASHFRIE